MRSRRVTIILGFSSLLTCGFVAAQRDRGTRTTQDEVQAAIRDGVRYLARVQTEGRWIYQQSPFVARDTAQKLGEDFDGGLTALALYSLAATGHGAKHPAVAQALAWCAEHPKPFAEGRRSTYSAALLTLALCRLDAGAHRKWIHRLATRIAKAQLGNGLWNYHLVKRKPDTRAPVPGFAWVHKGDASNTQFALLALWTAQLTAKFRVPSRVWQRVRSYHERTQHRDGGWSYKEPPPSGASGVAKSGPRPPVWMYAPTASMTAAGIVAYACSIAGLAGGRRGLEKARSNKRVKKGLVRLEKSRERWGTLLDNPYFAFSTERVAAVLALPDKDWQARVAAHLVDRQWQDGRWGRKFGQKGLNYGDRKQVYETSLALLSLARATRYPITPGRK